MTDGLDRKRDAARRRAKRSVRRTRAKLLAQARKAAIQRERNRAEVESRTADRGDADTHSTVPDGDRGRTTTASTVPSKPARSDVQPEPRLYGERLQRRIADD
jgi:hypothetical protein